MLRDAKGLKHVILICGKTDLRRGMDGLAALVRLHYGLDPLEEGTMFLFCGTRRDRIRALLYEGDGVVLITKRLTDGVFQWPRNSTEARDISPEQFKRLMEGFTLEGSIRSFSKIEEKP